MSRYIFTSESVTKGHPDKVCDIISDSVLDAYLEKDSHARVERFDLQRPIYAQTASYGHFGRDDLDLPWERTDLVAVIKKFAKGVA